MTANNRKYKMLHHITIEGCGFETKFEYNPNIGHGRVYIYTNHRHVSKISRSAWGEQHYTNNKEAYLERSKRQWSDNKEWCLAYQRHYRRNHPYNRRAYVSAAGSCNHLNKWFGGCRRHHVDPNTIIHIPADMHIRHPHNIQTGHGMDIINALAFNFLFQEGKP